MTKQELETRPVRVFEEWCKGCGICVSFCPKDVLALSHHGKAYVAHPQRCIQCRLCEQLCPDFAVSVKPKDKAKQGGKDTERKPVEDGAADKPPADGKPDPDEKKEAANADKESDRGQQEDQG